MRTVSTAFIDDCNRRNSRHCTQYNFRRCNLPTIRSVEGFVRHDVSHPPVFLLLPLLPPRPRPPPPPNPPRPVGFWRQLTVIQTPNLPPNLRLPATIAQLHQLLIFLLFKGRNEQKRETQTRKSKGKESATHQDSSHGVLSRVRTPVCTLSLVLRWSDSHTLLKYWVKLGRIALLYPNIWVLLSTISTLDLIFECSGTIFKLPYVRIPSPKRFRTFETFRFAHLVSGIFSEKREDTTRRKGKTTKNSRS